MRVIKLIFVSCLLVAWPAAPARAQDPPPARNVTILYHWITPDKAIIWRSPRDAEPLIAAYDAATREWTIAPAESRPPDEEWRATLRNVVRRSVPAADLSQLDDSDLWNYVLSRLRNEYGRVDWAEPRMPSTEIYLLPRVTQPAASKGARQVELAFIRGEAGRSDQPGRTVITFTFEPGAATDGVWKKTQTVDEGTVLGRPPTAALLKKIFGFAGGQAPAGLPGDELPEDAKQWAEFYDESIKQFLSTGEAPRHVMYTDERGRPLWFWCQRLRDEADLPASSRQMAGTPRNSPVQDLPVIAPRPAGRGVFTAIITAAALILLFTLAIVNLRYNLSGRLRRRLRAMKDARRAGAGAQSNLGADVLQKLYELAREHYRAKYGEDADALLAPLGRTHNLYLELAKANQLLEGDEQRKEAAVAEYLRASLKVEGADRAKVGHWVEVGKAAEAAASEVNGLRIPPEVAQQVNGKASNGPPANQCPTPEYLLAHWPALLVAFNTRLSEVTQARREAERLLQENISKQKSVVEAKVREIDSKWETAVERANKKSEGLSARLTDVSGSLLEEQKKVEHLRAEVSGLEGELKAAREMSETTREEWNALTRKAETIGQVRLLSRDLRQWLQGYFNSRMEKDAELRPVALLSSLINFSLCQMCFGIVEGRELLLQAAALNLFRFIQKFERQQGNKSDLAQARTYLEAITAQVADGRRDISAEVQGGNTFDPALFRGFLNRLMTDTEKDLSPFFIDVDQQQGTKIVTASAV